MKTTKIPEPMKTRWVEALRSGKYRQGQEELRSTQDEYCCLGVLCDLHNPRGWFVGEVGALYSGEGGLPPKEVARAIGMDTVSPNIVEDDLTEEDKSWIRDLNPEGSMFEFTIDDDDAYRYVALTALNDHGATFEQIANLIEKYM